MYRTPFTLERQFNRLQNEFDRLFGAGSRKSYPLLNAWGDEQHFFVEAELPGVNPENLELTVSEGVLLTIAGERQGQEHENSQYHRRERGLGKFSRTVQLPEEVDADSVEASLTNGILTVQLAKKVDKRPRSIQVKVK